MRRKHLVIGLMALVIVLASLGVLAARRAADRRFHTDLAAARKELEEGLVATAHKRLARLAAERPGDAEAAYQLGRCEATRGRFEAALDAWSRVPPDAPQAAPAALDSAQVAIQLGRVAEAERELRAVLHRPGPQAPALRHLLLIVLGQQGRTAEAGRLLESLWDDTALLPEADVDARLALLREHVGLDFEPFPLEFNLSRLGDATGPPGVDDRQALAMARAYLATRAGDFGRAEAELNDWLGRRPDDPAIWKARLDWAVAAGRPAPAREAMAHLPGAPPRRRAGPGAARLARTPRRRRDGRAPCPGGARPPRTGPHRGHGPAGRAAPAGRRDLGGRRPAATEGRARRRARPLHPALQGGPLRRLPRRAGRAGRAAGAPVRGARVPGPGPAPRAVASVAAPAPSPSTDEASPEPPPSATLAEVIEAAESPDRSTPGRLATDPRAGRAARSPGSRMRPRPPDWAASSRTMALRRSTSSPRWPAAASA